jgi:hypothetical protein
MDVRSESEAEREPDDRAAQRPIGKSSSRAHSSARTPRVRGVDARGAVQAMVGAPLDGHDPAVVRAGRPRRRPVSPRVRRRSREPGGVLRPVSRGDAAVAARLDQRGERRRGIRHDREHGGTRRPDAPGPQRAVPIQGSARCRGDRRAGRDSTRPSASSTPCWRPSAPPARIRDLVDAGLDGLSGSAVDRSAQLDGADRSRAWATGGAAR